MTLKNLLNKVKHFYSDVPHSSVPAAGGGGDKYKALAELDELFSSGPGTDHAPAAPGGSIFGATPMSSTYDSMGGASSMSKSQSAFGGFGGGGGGAAHSFAPSANPFGSPNSSSTMGFHGGGGVGTATAFGTSPSMSSTNNPNPFMAGAGAAPPSMNWGNAAMAAPAHPGVAGGGIRPSQPFPSGVPLQPQSAMFGGKINVFFLLPPGHGPGLGLGPGVGPGV